MYNRYDGNTGRVVRVPEPGDRVNRADTPTYDARGDAGPAGTPPASPAQGPTEPVQNHERTSLRPLTPAQKHARPFFKMPEKGAGGGISSLLSSLTGGLSGGLGGILEKFRPENLEMEDLMLMFILYFLYRESGDEELLITMGAMFLL